MVTRPVSVEGRGTPVTPSYRVRAAKPKAHRQKYMLGTCLGAVPRAPCPALFSPDESVTRHSVDIYLQLPHPTKSFDFLWRNFPPPFCCCFRYLRKGQPNQYAFNHHHPAYRSSSVSIDSPPAQRRRRRLHHPADPRPLRRGIRGRGHLLRSHPRRGRELRDSISAPGHVRRDDTGRPEPRPVRRLRHVRRVYRGRRVGGGRGGGPRGRAVQGIRDGQVGDGFCLVGSSEGMHKLRRMVELKGTCILIGFWKITTGTYVLYERRRGRFRVVELIPLIVHFMYYQAVFVSLQASERPLLSVRWGLGKGCFALRGAFSDSMPGLFSWQLGPGSI